MEPETTKEEIRNLESLPYELLLDLAIDMDVPTLLSLCRVSTSLSRLCQDESLWRYKFQRQYPKFMPPEDAGLFEPRQPPPSWRQIYLDAIRSSQSLYRSPQFREIYRQLKSEFPTIRFMYEVHAPWEQTDIPTLIRSHAPPPMISQLDSWVILALPGSNAVKVKRIINQYLSKIGTDFYVVGGLGPILKIYGKQIWDPHGDIIWVPISKRAFHGR